MTRLREEWLRPMRAALAEDEHELYRKTGLDYLGLAAASAGLSREALIAEAGRALVAIVPITSGEGVIGSFAESVAGIIEAAGFAAFVTEKSDVDGLYEAYTRGASAVFMADDDRYIALRLGMHKLADNNEWTARGYIAALEGAAGALSGREALVIGCGMVGQWAGKCLLEKGAMPLYHDINGERLKNAPLPEGAKRLYDAGCIGRFPLVFDATNTGGWLHEGMLMDGAFVASPGVPYSLDSGASARYGKRVIHDDLQIGTVAMLGALFN